MVNIVLADISTDGVQ